MHYSFEVYPPKDTSTDFRTVLGDLGAYQPDYISITYGARENAQDKSHIALQVARQSTTAPIAMHLTLKNLSQTEFESMMHCWQNQGVKRLVALRGDGVATENSAFTSSLDLIHAIRTQTEYAVSVAAYPEVHPDATNSQADLDWLCQKLDAGADEVITQVCFLPRKVLALREALAKRGYVPRFRPGLLPFSNPKSVRGLLELCGAYQPKALFATLEGNPPAYQRALVADVLAEHIRAYQCAGIEHCHIYTLNRPVLIEALFNRLEISHELYAEAV